MKKKSFAFVVLVVAFILTGCAGQQSATTTSAGTVSNPGANQADPGAMSGEAKLAIGTLMLEDSEKAVTAEQAKNLLPVWKAVKSLSSDDTVTQEEIQALYDQIRETMTSEQLQAIEVMAITSEEVTSLMEKLGIDAQFMTGNGPEGMENLTQEQRATQIAELRAQNPGFAPGGEGGPEFSRGATRGGEGPMVQRFEGAAGEGGVFVGPGGMQGTPVPGQAGGRRNLGMNMMFVDPLIELLQERAGA